MSIDFNQAGEQSSGTGKTIPPMSKVLVSLSIKTPPAGFVGSSPELCISKRSTLEYLATELTVLGGTYTGNIIYHNFNVAGANTEGQHKAIDISMRQLRALVESNYGIDPKDTSPYATESRMLRQYSDLQGMVFPIIVECKESRPNDEGKVYINNQLKSVVTVHDADYKALMNGEDRISDLPIPEVEKQQNAARPTPAQTFPANQAQTVQSYPGSPASGARPAVPSPAWTQRQQAPRPTPPNAGRPDPVPPPAGQSSFQPAPPAYPSEYSDAPF